MLQLRKGLGPNLKTLLDRKKSEVMNMKSLIKPSDLEQRLFASDRSVLKALRPGASRADRPALVASLRAKTPWTSESVSDQSVTALIKAFDPLAAVLSYECDNTNFGGLIDTVETLRASVTKPVIAREYIVDEYQLYYARANEADSIVLHACLLTADAIDELLVSARRNEMEPVVEVANEAELKEALETSAKIIAINNRDPETNQVDRETFHRLAPMVDAARILLAGGGINSRAEVDRLAGKADAVFVGSALLGGPDIAANARTLGF